MSSLNFHRLMIVPTVDRGHKVFLDDREIKGVKSLNLDMSVDKSVVTLELYLKDILLNVETTDTE